MNATLARLNPLRRGCGEHTHVFTQLLFGLGGTVHCDLCDGAFDVSCGQIGIVPRQALHYFVGRDDNSRLLVVDLYMEDEIVRQMEAVDTETGFDDLFVTPRAVELPCELNPLVSYAARQLGEGPAGPSVLARQWARMFALQAYELLRGSPRPMDSRPERLYALIDARLADPPDNAALEQHLAMSGSALNQWCHLCFGQTPQQVVLRRRLAWARQWLIETDRPIGRIAYDTGFADAPSFTRAFRRVYAATPAALRREATRGTA